MNSEDNVRSLFVPPTELPRRREPSASAGVAVLWHGEHVTDGPRVYIYRDVLDELMFHACYTQQRSSALLTGLVFDGARGPFMEIQGFIEASTFSDPVEWLTGLNRRFQMVINRFSRASDLMILGWSYAHYGCGGCVDADALLIHSTFFNLSHQLVLALDPDDETLGLYQRASTGALLNTGFGLVGARTEPASPHQDVERRDAPLECGADEVVVDAAPAVDAPQPVAAGGPEGSPDGTSSQATSPTKLATHLPSDEDFDNATASTSGRGDALVIIDDTELLSALEDALSGFGREQTFDAPQHEGADETNGGSDA